MTTLRPPLNEVKINNSALDSSLSGYTTVYIVKMNHAKAWPVAREGYGERGQYNLAFRNAGKIPREWECELYFLAKEVKPLSDELKSARMRICNDDNYACLLYFPLTNVCFMSVSSFDFHKSLPKTTFDQGESISVG